jgi:hypothetical protein
VWLVRKSPLGHQIKALTSTFSQMRLALAAYALVMGLGAQVPLGHARGMRA